MSYVQDHPLANQTPLGLLLTPQFFFHSPELLHGKTVHFIMRKVFQVHFLRSGSNTVQDKFLTESFQFRIGKGSSKTLLPEIGGLISAHWSCTSASCSISIIKQLRVFYIQDVKYQLIWFNISLIWFTKEKELLISNTFKLNFKKWYLFNPQWHHP